MNEQMNKIINKIINNKKEKIIKNFIIKLYKI